MIQENFAESLSVFTFLKEINPNAKFFAGGASRFDIEQGALGKITIFHNLRFDYSYLQNIQFT